MEIPRIVERYINDDILYEGVFRQAVISGDSFIS